MHGRNELVEGTAEIRDGYCCYENPRGSRPRAHTTKHKKSKAIDHEGPPSRGLTTRFVFVPYSRYFFVVFLDECNNYGGCYLKIILSRQITYEF